MLLNVDRPRSNPPVRLPPDRLAASSSPGWSVTRRSFLNHSRHGPSPPLDAIAVALVVAVLRARALASGPTAPGLPRLFEAEWNLVGLPSMRRPAPAAAEQQHPGRRDLSAEADGAVPTLTPRIPSLPLAFLSLALSRPERGPSWPQDHEDLRFGLRELSASELSGQ